MVRQPDGQSRGNKMGSKANQRAGSAGATARRHSTRERTGQQRHPSPHIHLTALAPHSVPQPFPFLASTLAAAPIRSPARTHGILLSDEVVFCSKFC
ncbi:unnamed protein product [Urochloa humidicola]